MKRVFLAAILTVTCGLAQAHTIKRFEWGIETWQPGQQDYVIRFDEKKPVKILDIEGNLTAGPQPDYKPYEMMIRQTLATLINVGDDADKMDVTVIGSPAIRANHVVSPHMFSVNVKQTNGETLNIPIAYHYGRLPVELHRNKLLFRIFNESYRHAGDGSFPSQAVVDALNVEIHLTITYEVN